MKNLLKKLSVLLAIALFSFSMVQKPMERLQVQATHTAFTWTSVNLFSTFYQLESSNMNIGGSRFVDVTFPYSTYHRFNITSIGNARMEFLSVSLTIVDTINLIDLNPSAIGGTYELDLNYLGVPTTALYIKVTIPQAYSSTPPNYVTGMNADSYYDPFPTYLKTANFYSSLDYYSANPTWGLEYNVAFVSIPQNPGSPSLYDPNDVGSNTYTFIGWRREATTYIYRFDELLSSYSDTVNFYAEWAQDFDVQFMNGLTVHEYSTYTPWDTLEYSILPPVPTDPTRSGYTFMGWKTQANEFYEFDRLLTLEEFNPSLDTTVYFYASFVLNAPSGTPLSPNTPAAITSLATFLSNLGWYNYPALMFLLFVLIIGINGFLAWKLQPPAFVYMVVSLVVSVLFMFMDLIPLYVMIPLMLLLVVGLIVSLKEGATA